MSAQFEVHRNAPELVIIGTQKWMLRNYDFGGTYPWGDFDLIKDYGSLFTWAQAMAINLPGWHLPSDVEVNTLISYLGGALVAGGAMKEVGTTYWHTPNTGATNSSGFSARGAGYNQDFFGTMAYFWTTSEFGTDAFAYALGYGYANINTLFIPKTNQFSVRLIKDV